MTVRCAGCHCTFSISGYSHHVQRTGLSACIAAYHAQIKHAEDTEEDHDDMEVFSGDVFGNYEDNEFDWPDDRGKLSAAYVFTIHIYPGSGGEDNDMEAFVGEFFGDYEDNEFDWPDDGGVSSVT